MVLYVKESNIPNGFWGLTKNSLGTSRRNDDQKNEESELIPEGSLRLLSTYFNDISYEPLLTEEEQKEIWRTITKCQARARETERLRKKISQESGGKQILKRKTERLDALTKGYEGKANRLKQKFTKANLRLVIKIAMDFLFSD